MEWRGSEKIEAMPASTNKPIIIDLRLLFFFDFRPPGMRQLPVYILALEIADLASLSRDRRRTFFELFDFRRTLSNWLQAPFGLKILNRIYRRRRQRERFSCPLQPGRFDLKLQPGAGFKGR